MEQQIYVLTLVLDLAPICSVNFSIKALKVSGTEIPCLLSILDPRANIAETSSEKVHQNPF